MAKHIYGSAVERFWPKVDRDGPVPDYAPHLGPCWLWTASIRPNGYGQFKGEDRVLSSHIWAYVDANGPVPEGLELDHLCRVRHCVRPSHLEAVTGRENRMRGAGCMKTHCPRGHALVGTNVWLTKKGHRRCRTCGRDRCRAYNRRIKALGRG